MPTMSTPPTAIDPWVIDAWVMVEYVKVHGRHRKDLGDLESLAKSIADVGLLNPITLTADGRLVAGQRRLEACRLLGWREMPVRFANNLTDAVALLHAERDENTCRKDMLPSELASFGAALHELEAKSSRARQGTRTDLGRELPGTAYQEVENRLTADAVGETLGLSGRAYQELRYVHQIATSPDVEPEERDLAEQALTAMNGGAGLVGEARRLRGKLRERHDARDARKPAIAPEPAPEPTPPADPEPEPDTEPAADADWMPAKGDSSHRAAARRRVLIAELAASGHSSDQISHQIDVLESTVRRIAREENINIPADKALGRQLRSIDSNRIVRETVQSLEGMSMGIDLIDFDALDATQIQDWTVSLTASIRVLNRLQKQLKETVQ